jgi:hypothetical protein
MSLILIISIGIRLVAMGWSIVLLRRIRDWRTAFLTAMLAVMATRQILTLLSERESWAITVTGHATELPGLMKIQVMVPVFLFSCLMPSCVVSARGSGLLFRLKELMALVCFFCRKMLSFSRFVKKSLSIKRRSSVRKDFRLMNNILPHF